jgi:cytochrome o ubiquinol oxidase subunit 2
MSFHSAGILDPQGPISTAERMILIDATAIMLVVVVPVIALTLFFAWRYRASSKSAAYRPDWSYSGQIEMVVWSIPAMVVILLAGVGWTGSHQLDPARELTAQAKPIRIEAVSLDWKWLFIYADAGVASVNELIIPAGTPIEFVLSSGTVMNAFFVPQLGSQIYTMPGMSTRLNLSADRAGDYPGFSSHFSGDGFSDMRFMVHAVPGPAFSAWLAKARSEGAPLDRTAYDRLAAVRAAASPATYRVGEPNLYEWIVATTAGRPAPAPAPAPTPVPPPASASASGPKDR